jgi:5-deoxy-glucuronate isomerase
MSTGSSTPRFPRAACWSARRSRGRAAGRIPPPHTHVAVASADGTPAEAVFLFRLNPPQGFGLQWIYSPEHAPDEVVVLTNDLVVKLRWGCHPVAAAPGYALYSLWALAGEARTLSPRYDPTHAWVADQPAR